MDTPRIIAVDLDGTLLRTGGTVSARTVRALELVGLRGAEVVAVTARPPRVLDHVLDQVPLPGMTICSNGAIRYDLSTGQVSITDPLAATVAADAIDRLRAALPGAAYAVETGLRVLYEPLFPHRSSFDYRFFACTDTAEFWIEAESIVKLLVWTADLAVEQAHDLARSALHGGVEVTYSGGSSLLEISAAGVTKATALATYCAEVGVSASQVIAFGDAPNDLPMLRWAGTGYAMANAHPLVLAATANHTASNNDDGVAAVLEQIFS